MQYAAVAAMKSNVTNATLMKKRLDFIRKGTKGHSLRFHQPRWWYVLLPQIQK